MMKRRFGIVMIAILLCTVCFSGSTMYASGNLWYDKYVALENSIGDDRYTSSSSATLAWGESYILRSYLTMYDVTGSTSWLDKFTTHVDTMLSNVNDDDGDGYEGWDTFAYSPVEVDNEGFEEADASDSTLPDSWTRFQSTASTAYRTTSAAYNGSYGVLLKTNGSSWQKMYQSMKDYEPNSQYVLRVYAKTNGSAAKGKAYVHDRTAGAVLASIVVDNTQWDYYEVEFTTPSTNGHNIEIWLGHNSYSYSGGEAYFDQVRVSGRFPYLVHDAMVGVPMAEFIRLIDQTPALQSTYQTEADQYQTFLEDEMIPKWEHSSYIGNTWKSLSATEGIYTQSPNLATLNPGEEGMHLAYNMSLAFGHMLKVLYDVNSNSAYLERAVKMHTYFRNNLALNGSAYTWNYWDRTSLPEDTSHGQVDIASILEMYHSGLVYTGDDMWKFSLTLVDHMWNGSKTDPKVGRYVSGLSQNQHQYTRILCNWLDLSQFHIDIWGIAAEQYRNYTATNTVELFTLAHIIKWDPQKAVNQDFELSTWFDATQPARWVRWQSSPSTAYLDSGNAYTGNYGVTIKGNGTTWQKLYQTWGDWQPSMSYTLTFYGKTDGSGAGGELLIYNNTTASTVVSETFTNTGWQQKTVTFTTPATSTDDLKIYLGNQTYIVNGGKAHFDGLVIKQTGDPF